MPLEWGASSVSDRSRVVPKPHTTCDHAQQGENCSAACLQRARHPWVAAEGAPALQAAARAGALACRRAATTMLHSQAGKQPATHLRVCTLKLLPDVLQHDEVPAQWQGRKESSNA